MKICRVCGEEKPQSEYHGNSAKCKPCQITYALTCDVGTHRRCRVCGEIKEISKFRKNNKNRGGYAHKCSRCENIAVAKLKYNIDNIYEYVSGKSCEICKRPISEGSGKFAIDHDHSCCAGPKTCGNCIRGILCGDCNKGIGYFGDSIAILENALAYLRRF